ncbi:hypothetical protein QFZ27_001687 [Inquilinus ginsengisoli]|uniref:hypothetical protein n=1 Tax=Inquilinus ginsengisoli TaxID=363840 RepID=UPI003D2356C4
MGQPSRRVAYAMLLILQTATASYLMWLILPIFRRVVSRLGEPPNVDLSVEIAIIGGAVVLQCCYWTRLRWIPVFAPFRSIVVGHLLLFASRASFFFGGALFSVIFFRHVPELDALPPLGQILGRALAVMAVLFSLFCYSLELERLGKAIEAPPRDDPR